MTFLIRWVATGFGTGYSPVAPGTVGSLPGIPLAWACCTYLPWTIQIPVALALTVLAIPFCGLAERQFGRKDDRRIVADEWMLFPLCVIGLPPHPLMFAIAFVFARGFDVLKLWPAHGLQRLTGGTGIVIDDFFAMLYALACNHIAYRVLLQLGWL